MPSQIQASRQPHDMSVNDDTASDAEGRPKHYVPRLSRYTRQYQDLFHSARHLPAERLQDHLARSHDGLRLVPKESSGTYFLLQLAGVGMRKRFRIGIFLIKCLRDFVYAHIRALRGQNR